MIVDQFRFHRRLQDFRRKGTQGVFGESERERNQLQSLQAEISRSIERVEQRGKTIPKVHYDSELPIVRRKEEITRLIRENQVLVVCGETGSGKSTQLPKICLELGRGLRGMIGHTQPRRIAARSVAARVAEELGSPLGQTVGFKVRFSDETGPNTCIKLMTDGILLAESQNDRFFEQYDTILIDEAHERSLNIDFLLGMMKRLLRKRRDLKLIITSATIDAKRFAEHFAVDGTSAPIIEVSGRTYPIEIRYRPLEEFFDEYEEPDEERALLKAVDELARESLGDMLIFMPTERDIFETAKLLRHHALPGDDSARRTEILPLYARLPVSQQSKVFKKHPHRRIVLATNVAESSLTVPGIRYVIDTGTARISRYSARSKTQRLPIEAISRASADQRAGRCGRVGPGVCVRLFSETDYNARDRYTTPEIQRTNLASVILQTKSLKLGAIETFPFLDPPKHAAIQDGYRTLHELGALDADYELTEIGRDLSRLPVDPRIARIILAAQHEDCLREILVIASVLEIQDPRERPHELREKADAAHRRFLDPQSDFLAWLNIWDFYHDLKDSLSRNQLRKACLQNFLSFNRMKEWTDIHLQLMQLIRDGKFRMKPRRDDYDAIHRCILTGYLSGIANRDDKNKHEYHVAGAGGMGGSGGATGGKFVLWPGSGLAKAADDTPPSGEMNSASETNSTGKSPRTSGNSGKPKWIVSAERLETNRRYLRTAARIAPEWIEPLAPHLVTKTYGAPFWSAHDGRVHAYERVSLFGLTIVPKRRVNYGPLDPEKARDVFIEQALVGEDIVTKCDFLQYNRMMLEEAVALQDKLRRHDLLRDAGTRFRFYSLRIPLEVYDRRTLESWYFSAPKSRRDALFFKFEDLCVGNVPEKTDELYPGVMTTSDGTEVPIEYRYCPGEIDDGLTITVPVEGLRQLEQRRLGWLVPGMLEAKIVELLRALPKEVRRGLVPIPDTARTLTGELIYAKGVLEEELAVAVSRLAGRRVTADDFRRERLADLLKMNIRVVDSDGKTLACGRELEELRKELGVKASRSIATVSDARWNRAEITQWDFGDLPESIELTRGKLTFKAFPMLVDRGESVALRVADSPDRASRETRLGLMRLFELKHRRRIKTQIEWIPRLDRIALHAQPLFSGRKNESKSATENEAEVRNGEQEISYSFCDSLAGLLAVRCMELDERSFPRNRHEFAQRMHEAKERFGPAIQDVTRVVASLFEAFQEARLILETHDAPRWDAARRDAKTAVSELLVPGFLVKTPWNRLKEYPRYLRAVAVRFGKLKSGGEHADRAATEELARFRERYLQRRELHEAAGIVDPELSYFRFMIEEFRVSLFAQKLGTVVKVSAGRLEKQWEKVRK